MRNQSRGEKNVLQINPRQMLLPDYKLFIIAEYENIQTLHVVGAQVINGKLDTIITYYGEECHIPHLE